MFLSLTDFVNNRSQNDKTRTPTAASSDRRIKVGLLLLVNCCHLSDIVPKLSSILVIPVRFVVQMYGRMPVGNHGGLTMNKCLRENTAIHL